MATIKELTSNDNFSRIEKVSSILRRRISETLDQFGVTHRMYGEGGIVNYTLSDDEIRTFRDISQSNMQKRKRIDSYMLGEGIYLVTGSRFSLILSHSEADIETTINSLEVALNEVLENNRLKK